MAIEFDSPQLNDHTQKHEMNVFINGRGVGRLRQVKGHDDFYRASKPVRTALKVPVMLGTREELMDTLRKVHIGQTVED